MSRNGGLGMKPNTQGSAARRSGLGTRDLLALALAGIGNSFGGNPGQSMGNIWRMIGVRNEQEQLERTRAEAAQQAREGEIREGKTSADMYNAMRELNFSDAETRLALANPESIGSNIADRLGPQSTSPGEDIYMRGRDEPLRGRDRIISVPNVGAFSESDILNRQGPTPGTVEDGMIFRGGNPADPNNWEPIGGSGGNAAGGFLGW